MALSTRTIRRVDISGWRIEGGIDFAFRPGTVIGAGGTLYVSPDVPAFRARTSGPSGRQGLFVQGNYAGHLSNFGETLRLVAADENAGRRDDLRGRTVARTTPPASQRTELQSVRSPAAVRRTERRQRPVRIHRTGQHELDRNGRPGRRLLLHGRRFPSSTASR